MEKLKKLIHMGKHYKIERFGITMAVILTLLVIDVFTIAARKVSMDKEELSDRSIYTTDVVTSLTNTNGTVEGIYRSTDKTKVFVLLHMDSMEKMSIKASDYQLFLTGSSPSQKQTELLGKPSGSVYVFGSQGYLGVYLVDARGFESQILDLVVRCNTSIAEADMESDAAKADASFGKYDQFRVYFNPGGASCEIAECLDEGDMTAFGVYEGLVARAQENAIRDVLKSNLSQMYLQLSLIEKYEEQMVQHGMRKPERPAYVKGDTITENEDGTYDFAPALVIPTGYDFDWQAGSIKAGYLKDLTNETPTAFFREKEKEVSGTVFTTETNWYYNNGSRFETSEDDIGITKTIKDDISHLQGAWDAYYELKKEYQCVNLKALLKLEAEISDIELDCTVNDGSKNDADTPLLTLY